MDDPDGPAPAPRRRYAAHDATTAVRLRPVGGAPRASRACDPTQREYRPREWEPTEPPERPSGPAAISRIASYEPPEPYDAPPAPSTHNPFSNVRYRGSADDEDDTRYRRPPRS